MLLPDHQTVRLFISFSPEVQDLKDDTQIKPPCGYKLR